MLALLADVIAIGSIGFWIGLAVFGIIISELSDRDKGINATIVAIIVFLGWFWLENIDPARWIAENPKIAILAILGYIVTGVLWGVLKWWLYCIGVRRNIEALAKEFRQQYKLGPDADIQKEWQSYLWRHTSSDSIEPSAHKNKSRIILWMSYWPCSMLWTLINDPVRRIFLYEYYLLGKLFQDISNAIFKDFDINKYHE